MSDSKSIRSVVSAMTIRPMRSFAGYRHETEERFIISGTGLSESSRMVGYVARQEDAKAFAALANHSDAVIDLIAACEIEESAVCTTNTEHWDAAEQDDSLCFGDIHCAACPVTAARNARRSALAAVHAVKTP